MLQRDTERGGRNPSRPLPAVGPLLSSVFVALSFATFGINQLRVMATPHIAQQAATARGKNRIEFEPALPGPPAAKQRHTEISSLAVPMPLENSMQTRRLC